MATTSAEAPELLRAENEALRRRVAELEAALKEERRSEQVMRDSAELLRGIADNAPLLIYAKDLAGRYIMWNRGCEALMFLPASQVLGKTSREIFPKELADAYDESDRQIIATGKPETMEQPFAADDGVHYFFSNRFAIRSTTGEITATCGILIDLTDVRRTQEENRRLQEEMLRVQGETLRALSTPLLPIAEQVVAMPLIGTMNRERAQQVIDTMLHGVATRRARVAILDLTGMPSADTEVANALMQTARAVRLLGAEVVVTGIQPEIAQTLITLGIDLAGITTKSTLQQGIAYALSR